MTQLGTLFNISYLNRGLALIESLKKHYNGRFQLFILCLDRETHNYLKNENYKFVQLILIDEIESFYPELLYAKRNRTLIEYYFTLSPVFPLYILETFKISQITTMDADIFFFSNPEPLFKEIENHSISIMPHNFSEGLIYKAVYGKYNISFQSFKNNKEGLECLMKWKDQCIEWCYDTLEDNRFADQKYLNDWPDIYKDLFEIKKTGTGVAPWNLDKYLKENTDGKGKFKSRLIFYHFHQLRFVGKNIIDLGLSDYLNAVNRVIINKIYRPYIIRLLKQKNNQDDKISRNNTIQISVKQAFNSENAFFYYRFGILFNTSKIRSFLVPIKRAIRFFLNSIPNEIGNKAKKAFKGNLEKKL